MIARQPVRDAWEDEQRHSLLDGRARYKATAFGEPEPARRRPIITLPSRVTFLDQPAYLD